jgi:hypothetical protein
LQGGYGTSVPRSRSSAISNDPEAFGRKTAELLVGGLEQLKTQLIDTGSGSLAEQLLAGQAAVEAMKRLLGDVTDDLMGDDPHR